MESKRWTISEITRYVRDMFEMDYRLQDLEVEGEISDFRIPGSGHAYFTLKDANAQLKCVMWRSDVAAQPYLPEQGDRVIAQGAMSVYEAGGVYQMYCNRLRLAGQGDLHAQFEALKARLAEEGLFDAERKQSPPGLPLTIGVATSLSTAALQDVLNVLRRRYPLARVLIADTAVQGEQAPPQIVQAIKMLNRQKGIDVLLVVRGGGSLEDLWCFNDEQVARAIANSSIPIISGVGHEIDFTLADFAADVRAPTPSAAAEMATPITIDDLRGAVEVARVRLIDTLGTELTEYRQQVKTAERDLQRLSPERIVGDLRQRADMLRVRAQRAVANSVALKRSALTGTQRALDSVSPVRTLARGYAIVQGEDGNILRNAEETARGERINIRLHRGRLQATVEEQETANE